MSELWYKQDKFLLYQDFFGKSKGICVVSIIIIIKHIFFEVGLELTFVQRNAFLCKHVFVLFFSKMYHLLTVKDISKRIYNACFPCPLLKIIPYFIRTSRILAFQTKIFTCGRCLLLGYFTVFKQQVVSHKETSLVTETINVTIAHLTFQSTLINGTCFILCKKIENYFHHQIEWFKLLTIRCQQI